MNIKQAERILDEAEEYYLLGEGSIFKKKISHDREARADFQAFEESFKEHPSMTVSNYRTPSKVKGWQPPRPSEVSISWEALLQERPELDQVKTIIGSACSSAKQINLKEFLQRNFKSTIQRNEKGERNKIPNLVPAVEILEYMLANRDGIRGFYPKQIRHGHSTKLIGNERLLLRLMRFHLKGTGISMPDWADFKAYFELRDKPLSLEFFAVKARRNDGSEPKSIHGIIHQYNLDEWDFSQLRGTLIVENPEAFLDLHGHLNDCLLILGNGNAISGADHLKGFLPSPILYWGDMDAEGYRILGRVDHILGHVTPICMSLNHLFKHRRIRTPLEEHDTAAAQDKDTDFFEISSVQPAHRLVLKHNLRIEQEKIPRDEVIAAVREMLESS